MDHLNCILKNLYDGHQGTDRLEYEATKSFKIGERVYQGYIPSPYIFNLFANVMGNVGLEELVIGIKIAGGKNQLPLIC